MTTPGFGGMGLLDSFMFGGGFEILFFLIFALVLCLFIVMIVRGVSQWHRNNNSPRLTVEATVVAKRIDVSHHHHGGETHHMTTSTRYYVTFQVESGDRMELEVPDMEYGRQWPGVWSPGGRGHGPPDLSGHPLSGLHTAVMQKIRQLLR